MIFYCFLKVFILVQALIERGAPVNFKYVSRKPKLRPYPLHVAVFRNRLHVVQYLLSQGADPLLKNYILKNLLTIFIFLNMLI